MCFGVGVFGCRWVSDYRAVGRSWVREGGVGERGVEAGSRGWISRKGLAFEYSFRVLDFGFRGFGFGVFRRGCIVEFFVVLSFESGTFEKSVGVGC